jgi:hypothetical protein
MPVKVPTNMGVVKDSISSPQTKNIIGETLAVPGLVKNGVLPGQILLLC